MQDSGGGDDGHDCCGTDELLNELGMTSEAQEKYKILAEVYRMR